jgi:hypothetical protein
MRLAASESNHNIDDIGSQRLDGVGTDIGASVLVRCCQVAHANTTGNNKERQRIHVSRSHWTHKVRKTEIFTTGLAREGKALQHL